jgi:hypothetical protein
MGNRGSEDVLNAEDSDDAARGGGAAGRGSGDTLGDADDATGGNTGDDTGDLSMVSGDFGESGHEERSTYGSVAVDQSADVGAGDTGHDRGSTAEGGLPWVKFLVPIGLLVGVALLYLFRRRRE